MKNVLSTKIPIDEPQKDQLRTLFASPAYLLLREVIVAHCTEHQMDFANKSMYANENAKEQAEVARSQASRFMGALDVLDDLQKIEDQWFRIALETRR
jgi:hypothetical protein